MAPSGALALRLPASARAIRSLFFFLASSSALVLFPGPKKPVRDRPYVSNSQCAEFAAGLQLKPPAKCTRQEVDLETDACFCELELPANVHAIPETMESVIYAGEHVVGETADEAVPAGVEE